MALEVAKVTAGGSAKGLRVGHPAALARPTISRSVRTVPGLGVALGLGRRGVLKASSSRDEVAFRRVDDRNGLASAQSEPRRSSGAGHFLLHAAKVTLIAASVVLGIPFLRAGVAQTNKAWPQTWADTTAAKVGAAGRAGVSAVRSEWSARPQASNLLVTTVALSVLASTMVASVEGSKPAEAALHVARAGLIAAAALSFLSFAKPCFSAMASVAPSLPNVSTTTLAPVFTAGYQTAQAQVAARSQEAIRLAVYIISFFAVTASLNPPRDESAPPTEWLASGFGAFLLHGSRACLLALVLAATYGLVRPIVQNMVKAAPHSWSEVRPVALVNIVRAGGSTAYTELTTKPMETKVLIAAVALFLLCNATVSFVDASVAEWREKSAANARKAAAKQFATPTLPPPPPPATTASGVPSPTAAATSAILASVAAPVPLAPPAPAPRTSPSAPAPTTSVPLPPWARLASDRSEPEVPPSWTAADAAAEAAQAFAAEAAGVPLPPWARIVPPAQPLAPEEDGLDSAPPPAAPTPATPASIATPALAMAPPPAGPATSFEDFTSKADASAASTTTTASSGASLPKPTAPAAPSNTLEAGPFKAPASASAPATSFKEVKPKAAASAKADAPPKATAPAAPANTFASGPFKAPATPATSFEEFEPKAATQTGPATSFESSPPKPTAPAAPANTFDSGPFKVPASANPFDGGVSAKTEERKAPADTFTWPWAKAAATKDADKPATPARMPNPFDGGVSGKETAPSGAANPFDGGVSAKSAGVATSFEEVKSKTTASSPAPATSFEAAPPKPIAPAAPANTFASGRSEPFVAPGNAQKAAGGDAPKPSSQGTQAADQSKAAVQSKAPPADTFAWPWAKAVAATKDADKSAPSAREDAAARDAAPAREAVPLRADAASAPKEEAAKPKVETAGSGTDAAGAKPAPAPVRSSDVSGRRSPPPPNMRQTATFLKVDEQDDALIYRFGVGYEPIRPEDIPKAAGSAPVVSGKGGAPVLGSSGARGSDSSKGAGPAGQQPKVHKVTGAKGNGKAAPSIKQGNGASIDGAALKSKDVDREPIKLVAAFAWALADTLNGGKGEKAVLDKAKKVLEQAEQELEKVEKEAVPLKKQ